ncbi:CIC11C00000005289 [Sungouiella intermedia]|uniref:alpha-1,2-Mannosidase n=1 Tax=Sungouiella intermedia TaxID=45354 RepID=A0A1L0B8N3_9ASCO|nr:CIC11C00000005289 [[Candida] intermedia]
MIPWLLLWIITVVLANHNDASQQSPIHTSAFTPIHLANLRLRSENLFRHGWRSYMDYGFPADEVRPLTCEPYDPDYTDPNNLRNDAMGNVSLTLIDNLDTLIVMRQWLLLEGALTYLKQNKDSLFVKDTVVQVFEASIRWLGGLLLTHLALTDVDWTLDSEAQRIVDLYDGFLLVMAYDLGIRLIPAYKTATQLPFPRINLKYGLDAVPDNLNVETCTSGATTPLVEFSLLLRLTGDPQFESYTSQTFWKLWMSRLQLGFMPMSIDPVKNKWLDEITGIGALVDSFYEYALKGAIIFNDNRLWDVFVRSYQSLLSHLAQGYGIDGYTYFANVNIVSGAVASTWIDLLGAFWAGVQVLAGRLSDAVSSHLVYLKIWDHYDSIPERWVTKSMVQTFASHQEKLDNSVSLEWYPLRPEFIESTYYLYRATRDPMYLQIGVRILHLFETRYKAPCGFAGVQDIRTGKRQNRMETFVLGELIKYLYLLFDEANESFVHSTQMRAKNWVFSTEAHPLWYSSKLGKRSAADFEQHLLDLSHQEPVFQGPRLFDSLWHKLRRSQKAMNDTFQQPKEPFPPNLPYGPDLVPTHIELDKCEVSPRQFPLSKPKFLSSGYLHWNKVFLPEAMFSSTLVRPQHLNKYDLQSPESYIEISESFISTYGLAAKNFKCPRRPTTFEQEYIFGKLSRPEEIEMFRVERRSDSLPFSRHDLVMPQLEGRVRLETLKPGTIDSNNLKISRDYIRRKYPEKYISPSAEVLRLNKVNGIQIGKNRTVWTDRGFLEQNPDTFLVSSNNQVYLQGVFVENLRAYTFPTDTI